MIEVDYINHMGDDLQIVNAARVSFNKQHKEFQDNDSRLIDFLARNEHWTPFGHTAICLRISAPLFIRTQCFKHKVGFVENEVSRRYVDDEPEFYFPETIRQRAKDKKQGSDYGHPESDDYKDDIQHCVTECTAAYNYMINHGVAPEQARMVLPQNMMTQWFWTGSLAAYARFYNLRSASDAQKEIQYVAEKVKEVVEPLFPVSWSALTKDRNA